MHIQISLSRSFGRYHTSVLNHVLSSCLTFRRRLLYTKKFLSEGFEYAPDMDGRKTKRMDPILHSARKLHIRRATWIEKDRINQKTFLAIENRSTRVREGPQCSLQIVLSYICHDKHYENIFPIMRKLSSKVDKIWENTLRK